MKASKLEPARAILVFSLLWISSVVLDTAHLIASARLTAYPHSENALKVFWWLPALLMAIVPIYLTATWTIPGRGGVAAKIGLTGALLVLAAVAAITAIAMGYLLSFLILGGGAGI